MTASANGSAGPMLRRRRRRRRRRRPWKVMSSPMTSRAGSDPASLGRDGPRHWSAPRLPRPTFGTRRRRRRNANRRRVICCERATSPNGARARLAAQVCAVVPSVCACVCVCVCVRVRVCVNCYRYVLVGERIVVLVSLLTCRRRCSSQDFGPATLWTGGNVAATTPAMLNAN